MKWLVQDTGRLINVVNEELTALKNTGRLFSVFGLIEHHNIITNVYDEDLDGHEVIFRGGIKAIHMLSNNTLEGFSTENIEKLKRGISYDVQAFDQRYYAGLNLPLLNAQASYEPFSAIKDKTYSKDMFIKPSSDLKAFAAGILKAGTTVEEYILKSTHQMTYLDEHVLVSDLKQPGVEYRFVCIDGEAIAGSSYLDHGKFCLTKPVDKSMLKMASEFASLYKPSDIYVMDLALSGNEVSIIEHNCWNGSGLYNIDMERLFMDVESYKNSR